MIHGLYKEDPFLFKSVIKKYVDRKTLNTLIKILKLESISDNLFWGCLSTIYLHHKNPKYDHIRAKKRASEISLEITNNYPTYISTRYLDVGAGSGHITYYVGKKIKARQIHGIDINDDFDRQFSNDVDFQVYDGITVPNNKYNIITILMVLHHVKNLKSLLKSVYNSMATSGCLVIKEHDITSDFLTNLVKFQHRFVFKAFTGTIVSDMDNYYENYMTKQELRELITSFGFKLINKSRKKIKNNPTNYYYDVYVKD